MQISIEPGMSPLRGDFGESIRAFSETPGKSVLHIVENGLNIQIHWEIDDIINFLTEETKGGFAALEHVVPTMKLVKSNQTKYAANF